ncbi:uncharacterized protein LOC105199855 [Solenopsis invicta]|uniref:uncharacterized protein LOC105199855 n=1 Tax=Solenopsis invicta TaxID=13686 RepID=UPI000E33FB99|nr:uncharacterized protein LOC105199855 [Solenopsis invicta]
MQEEIAEVKAEDNLLLIEHTLRPITYTSWLLGVGIARPQKYPKAVTVIIRIIHSVLCSIEMIKEYKLENNSKCATANDVEYAFKSVQFVKWLICHVSTYYYVYNGISQFDKWPELMHRLEEIDQKIRKEISMSDWRVIKVEALAIFATFACCPLFLIVHVLYYYFAHPECNYVSDLLFYYISAQTLINSFVFNVIVYVLYYRFQTINKLIGQWDEISDASWVALKIRRIRELHSGIRVLIITVNDTYGPHFLICSVNCFIMIVASLFKMSMDETCMDEKAFVIKDKMFWLLHVMQFGLTCWICTLAQEESQRTGTFVYAFVLNCKNLDVECIRNEVNDFSVQLQQYRVAFTACNSFEVNNALFIVFVAITAVYLIILV